MKTIDVKRKDHFISTEARKFRQKPKTMFVTEAYCCLQRNANEYQNRGAPGGKQFDSVISLRRDAQFPQWPAFNGAAGWSGGEIRDHLQRTTPPVNHCIYDVHLLRICSVPTQSSHLCLIFKENGCKPLWISNNEYASSCTNAAITHFNFEHKKTDVN
jgi:hypothetical protein